MSSKVGLGYDIHRFKDGRSLWLGGVKIPFARGLDGHSDADVVLHALCDALLGALGKGDIGEHFPNTESKWKDASGIMLLEHIMSLVRKEGYRVGNADIVIQAEEPNLKSHKQAMRQSIAKGLEVNDEQVNIKATTQEGLGSLGRKEGIASYAVVLIEKKGK